MGPIVFCLLLAEAPTPDLARILEAVAGSQERAEKVREHYTYHQKILVRFNRANRKLAREEIREYNVAPTATGVEKKLVRFEGRYDRGAGIETCAKPHYKYKDVDIDGDLVSDFADDLMNDRKSKDGVETNLFPLTREQQKKYTFRFAGRAAVKARPVYKVEFEPSDKKEFGWAGELWVDEQELQPVRIATRLSRNIPMWVRTTFGISFRQLGFSVAYDRFDGVWFPVSYGTEFYMRLLFGYRRHVILSLVNNAFQKTDVQSTILFDEPIAR